MNNIILFWIILLAEFDGLTWIMPFGTIRPFHILLPLLFWKLIFDRTIIKNILFKPIFVIFITLIIFSILGITGERWDSTYGNIANMWINFTAFLISFGIVKQIIKRNEISTIVTYSSFQIYISLTIILFQLILTLTGTYKPVGFGEQGLLNLGRPAAFFIDANWLSIWVFGHYAVVAYYNHLQQNKRQLRYSTIALISIFIIIQSRVGIAMAIMLSYFFIPKSKRIIYFIFIVIFAIFILFNYSFLPSNMYYDIIDVSNNPRIFSGIEILANYDPSKLVFGHGLGSIPALNYILPGREFSTAFNVYPVQVLYEFGLFGFFLLLFNLIGLLYSLRKHKILFILIFQLAIFMCFHNSIYKQYFWIILSLILSLPLKTSSLPESDSPC